MTRTFFISFFGLVLPGALFGQNRIADLAIAVTGTSREFAYTNKESAFLYGETNGENRSSWQGFNVYGREIIDGYALLVNEKRLSPGAALSCTVYPDHLERTYPGGIVEEVRPVDSLALFAIVLRSPRPIEIGMIPWFTDARDISDLTLELRSELALVARNSHLSQAGDSPAPCWLAIHAPGSAPRHFESRERDRYSPILLYSGRAKRHLIIVAAGATMEAAAELVRNFPGEATARFAARRARMEKLLAQSKTSTENSRFNRALGWAKLSLDALIMNQGKKGIFAGLPWFNNYWGRDTFISLPGAVLVTGRFAEAREILRSFGDYQERDSSSSDYGRIPNFVNPTDRAYNTADGTPRFIMMAKEYIERSGDRRFLAEMYPVVVRSIEGTLRHHSDSLGFLTHGDAESWMDAAGPKGAWSPRGNRANDVEELWAAQLEAGIWFATGVGDVAAARSWSSILGSLRKNFQSYFVQRGKVADHVTVDGRADWSLRPNQIFTAPLLDEGTRAAMVFRVTSELAYPYGVASLSQDDPRFHPYHQNPPYYPKDAAYHNGTVWTWLQGPLISELCRYGQAETGWRITSNSVHQILDRGAVGTQSELLDALPRPGSSEPALSGTFSQAWNLAEFIRNWYDDYLGLSIKLFSRTLTLQPNVPEALGTVEANVSLGEAAARVRISRTDGTRRIELRTENLGFSLHASIRVRTAENNLLHISFSLPDGIPSTIAVQGDAAKVVVGNREVPAEVTIDNAPTLPMNLGKLRLASPVLKQGLSSLKGPDHPVLTSTVIKAHNQSATLLVDATDSTDDDSGIVPGAAYSYPRNPLFVKGSFDLTRLTVSFDSTAVYFSVRCRALSNPGWHPEYGFQLTCIAIAIDTDGIPDSGSRTIAHNASVTLDRAYERLILVGGGVRIEDGSGKILAEYFPVPGDIAHPLGDAASGTITFAIPRSFLGTPSASWRFAVLSGGQDDHGGAGLGEFRTVNRERGEWNGGGKLRPGDPNIYDELDAPAKR